MKNNKLLLTITFLFFLIPHTSFSQQEIINSWEGILDAGSGNHLKIIFNISKREDGKLTASLDSPNQGAKGIQAENPEFDKRKISISVPSIGGVYDGNIDSNFTKIEGEWKQGGKTFPLILTPISKAERKLEFFSLWQGKLKIKEIELRLNLRFYKDGKDSIGAFLDSPDQSIMNIPATKVYYGDDSVLVEIQSIKGFYTGKFNNDKSEIDGKWNQNGSSFSLKLEKTEKIIEVKRPQEPRRPYPYNEEEITFKNKIAGITLSGTLTYPKEGTNFPAVVLVTGSGPQNRDEEVFGHKPFLVWSDYLTRNGVAVLRYDDRGIGKSKGIFNSATTADFVTDAISAIEYLKSRKEIDKKNIGLAGHSEGGVIAPIAANRCKDISFIVLGAGTAVPGDEIILLQIETISRLSGVSEEEVKREYEINKKTFDIIKSSHDSSEAAEKINEIYTEYYNNLPDSEKSKPENSSQGIKQKEKSFLSPWMRYFLKYDPRTELVKLNVPVLALFGGKDIQVSPSQNKYEMEKALQKSKSENFKVVVLPGLNHVFQECETGAITEYARIEQTTSPIMLTVMTDWIKEITK